MSGAGELRDGAARLLRVERLPVWELEPGDMFECNGTQWMWGEDFSCLQILPSGWPALLHCHGPDTFFIILITIAIFIFLYANLVGLYKGWEYIRASARKYRNRKLMMHRMEVPFIEKDHRRPYINTWDLSMLQKDPNKPSTVSSSEISSSYWRYY